MSLPKSTGSVAAALLTLFAVLTLAASVSAAPAERAGKSKQGCEIEAEGSLSGKRSFELEAELKRGRLDGELEFRDKDAKLEFESTAITQLVVAGRLASVQGHGKTKTKRSPSLRFSATLDAAARTFDLRLSSGYRASGVLAGKGDDDEIELEGSCPFDGESTPLLDTPRRVSSVIGRAGGALASGGLTLTIPAGALSEDTTIALTPLLDLAGSPLAGTVIGGAKLEPEGLRFLRPALLTFGLPAGTTAAQLVGFGSEGDGSELHLQPRTVSAEWVSLQLWHFSTAGASSGAGAAAAAVASRVPSSAETAALQRIAVAEAACATEQAGGIEGGPACANLLNEIAAALSDWYRASVSPGLRQALGAPSFEIEAALAEWLFWQQETEVRLGGLLGPCGPLQLNCSDARAAATAAVADMAERRLQNCTGTSLASQLRDIARVADFADAGAIDLPGAGLPANMLYACAHLEIEVTHFPAIAALFHANTLRGRVTLVVHTGDDRNPVPLTLKIDGADVATLADGTFQTTITPGDAGEPLDVELKAEANEPDLQNPNFTAIRDLTNPTRARLKLIAQSPTSIAAGGTVALLVQVAGDGMRGGTVTLSVGGPGSVSPSPVTTNAGGEATSVYTAPALTAVPNANVTAALPDGTSAMIPISITPLVTVGLTPTSATVAAGGTQNFAATVTGSFLGVTWSATGGAIVMTGSTTARYEAGSTAGTFSVTATSIADGTKTATATITITSASSARVTVLSRSSGTAAGCSTLNATCPGDSDDSSELLGVFPSGAEATIDSGSHPDFPGYVERATGHATLFSDVDVAAPFLLTVAFSGTADASANAVPGVNPESGGVLRAGAAAGGSSQTTVTFEVSGGSVPFDIGGGATLSGNACVEVSLRRSGGPREFDADFCADDAREPLHDSGTLAPGVYTFAVTVSAGASRAADYVDGVLVTEGTASGSGNLDLDLVLLP